MLSINNEANKCRVNSTIESTEAYSVSKEGFPQGFLPMKHAAALIANIESMNGTEINCISYK